MEEKKRKIKENISNDLSILVRNFEFELNVSFPFLGIILINDEVLAKLDEECHPNPLIQKCYVTTLLMKNGTRFNVRLLFID